MAVQAHDARTAVVWALGRRNLHNRSLLGVRSCVVCIRVVLQRHERSLPSAAPDRQFTCKFDPQQLTTTS